MQMPQAVTGWSDRRVNNAVDSFFTFDRFPPVRPTALSSELSKDAMRRPRAALVATRLLSGQRDDINATEWYLM